jgi:hypothetical protein
MNPKPLAPNKPKASIDFVSKGDTVEVFTWNISYRIMIFKMNLNFDLLQEKVAMEDRHFQKHFRMNLEDLMEETVAMVLTLSFKVNINNKKSFIETCEYFVQRDEI